MTTWLSSLKNDEIFQSKMTKFALVLSSKSISIRLSSRGFSSAISACSARLPSSLNDACLFSCSPLYWAILALPSISTCFVLPRLLILCLLYFYLQFSLSYERNILYLVSVLTTSICWNKAVRSIDSLARRFLIVGIVWFTCSMFISFVSAFCAN